MDRNNKVFLFFELRRARLRTSQFLFPLPFLIGALLVLFVMGLTVLNINPRLGHKTDPMHFSGTPAEISSLWMSIRLVSDKIIITTNDRKIFQWKRGEGEQLEIFNAYLAARSKEIILDAVLKGFMKQNDGMAVLSVDQKLTYQDMKPILASLAHARFHRYAFETRLNPL